MHCSAILLALYLVFVFSTIPNRTRRMLLFSWRLSPHPIGNARRWNWLMSGIGLPHVSPDPRRYFRAGRPACPAPSTIHICHCSLTNIHEQLYRWHAVSSPTGPDMSRWGHYARRLPSACGNQLSRRELSLPVPTRRRFYLFYCSSVLGPSKLWPNSLSLCSSWTCLSWSPRIWRRSPLAALLQAHFLFHAPLLSTASWNLFLRRSLCRACIQNPFNMSWKLLSVLMQRIIYSRNRTSLTRVLQKRTIDASYFIFSPHFYHLITLSKDFCTSDTDSLQWMSLTASLTMPFSVSPVGESCPSRGASTSGVAGPGMPAPDDRARSAVHYKLHARGVPQRTLSPAHPHAAVSVLFHVISLNQDFLLICYQKDGADHVYHHFGIFLNLIDFTSLFIHGRTSFTAPNVDVKNLWWWETYLKIENWEGKK